MYPIWFALFACMFNVTSFLSYAETKANDELFPVQMIVDTPDDMQDLLPSNHGVAESEGDSSLFGQFTRTMGMLLGILLFLLLLMWVIRKLFHDRVEQLNASSLIQVIDKRILSQKTTIYILEIGEKQIVLAESYHGIAFLNSSKSERQF